MNEVPRRARESGAAGKTRLTVRALAAGLVFTLVYGAFELRHFGAPDRLSLGGDTDTLSVFHYPLIWLLSGVMVFCALHAVGTIRHRTLRRHPVAFSCCTAWALLIAVFWAAPLIGRLTVPPYDAASCTASAHPATDPVVIHYSTSGFCPVRVVVSSGTRVEFVVDERASLHLSSSHAALNQEVTGGTYATTFIDEGTFSYSDAYSEGFSFHKFMSELLGRTTNNQGVITVVASSR